MSDDKRTPTEIFRRRLDEAGSTGLDMSPGDPLAAEAAAALRAQDATIEALQNQLETIKSVTKKDMQAKMDKALSNAAKHREKLMKENHEMYAKRIEAEKALEALRQQIAKDGSTIDAMKGHVETREKDCVCPVCRMHDRTTSLTQSIEALNAMIEGFKAKIKEQKETLKGFTGPKPKKG